MTSIEWTDRVWNPTVGCTRVSPGCEHCYAERIAHRGMTETHRGLTVAGKSGPRWTGEVRTISDRLSEPLRWRKPCRVFVNSMSDLFHESVPDEFIDRVWATMLLAPHCTFQVLTKRPERMRAYLSDSALYGRVLRWADVIRSERPKLAGIGISDPIMGRARWIWLGTSAEDQHRANERVPHLLQTPAAVRFLSLEPLLGPIDLTGWGDHAPSRDWESAPSSWSDFAWPEWVPRDQRAHIAKFWSESNGRSPRDWLRDHVIQHVPATGARFRFAVDRHGYARVNKMSASGVEGRYVHCWNNIGRVVTDDGACLPAAGGMGSGWMSRWLTPAGDYRPKIGWVIAGGESGPGARPCDVEWIRSIVRQCREAGVAAFVKQLGAKPMYWMTERGPYRRLELRDRKGGDMSEWPEDLSVREMPAGSETLYP